MSEKYRIKSYELIASPFRVVFVIEQLDICEEFRVCSQELLLNEGILYHFSKKEMVQIAYTAGSFQQSGTQIALARCS